MSLMQPHLALAQQSQVVVQLLSLFLEMQQPGLSDE
jgi:hypothetical protein